MPQNVFSSCSPVILGCFLYTDSGLTTPAPDGVYSDGLDVFTVSGGAGEITASALCSNFTTSTTTTTTTATPTTTTSTTTTTTTAAPILACLGYDASSALLACQDFGNCGTTTTTTSTTTTTTTVASTSWQARYSNSIGTVCATPDVTVYTASGATFTSGDTVYTDSALTNPLLGFDFISELISGTVYNFNSGTGVIGSNTGNTC